jgi:hypothetical protein
VYACVCEQALEAAASLQTQSRPKAAVASTTKPPEGGFVRNRKSDYLAPEAAEAAGAAALAAPAAAEAAPADASAAGAEAGAAAGADAAGAAGFAAGTGAGSCLLQAPRTTAAIRVAKTSDFFISGFLLWIQNNFRKLSKAAVTGRDD